MSTKANALRTARRFGFVLDETVTGKFGLFYLVTFDHPSMSIGGDCRSIHCEDISAPTVWAECVERMEVEGPLLEPCPCPDDCDYHNS